jgi:hypothetical protein
VLTCTSAMNNADARVPVFGPVINTSGDSQ